MRLGAEVLPDAGRAEVYRAQYARYRAAYPALRAIMHGLSEG